jgi:hypothetical protein
MATNKNKIEDLRNHLFETLESLRSTEKPMELERAAAIADVAKVIVESAKVEVAFLKVTGERKSTDFLPIEENEETRSPRRLQ